MTAPLTGTPEVDDVATARRRVRPLRGLTGIVLAVIVAQVVNFLIRSPRLQWDVVGDYLFDPSVLAGLGVTVMLAVIAMTVAIVLGGALAAAELSDFRPVRWAATLYIGLFRAIPPLVQLIFWFNLAYLLPRISVGIPFGPVFESWSASDLITPFSAGVIRLSLVESAYIAEIIRGGLLGVDQGQRKASKAIGFTPLQTLARVVLPQGMRIVIPPTGNQFVSVVKGTALVSVIAMSDLLHAVQVIYNRTYEIVPMLLVASIWYLVVVTALTLGQRGLEKRFGRGYRPLTQGARS